MKVKDIPKWEEFERLQREDPAEYERLYRESMKCLTKASMRISIISIIISLVAILLSLMRVLIQK